MDNNYSNEHSNDGNDMDAKWREKAAKAKKGHRPSLRNWERDGLALTFPPYAAALLASPRPYSSFRTVPGIDGDRAVAECAQSLVECLRRPGDRIAGAAAPPVLPVVLEAGDLKTSEFHAYETRGIPVVIRNIPQGGTEDGDSMSEDEEEKKECDGQPRQRRARGSDNNDDEAWPAVRRWTQEALAVDPDLADAALKCGEDDDGGSACCVGWT